jgi:uncharacterized protein YkwD
MRAMYVVLLNGIFFVALFFAVGQGFGVTVYETEPVQPEVKAAVTNNIDSHPQDLLLAEINTERTSRGLPLLIPKTELIDIATMRNNDMVDNQYYAHYSPHTGDDFSSFFDKFPVESCENLQLDSSSRASGTVKAWLESTNGHRECLLNSNLRYIGYETRLFTTYDSENGHESAYVTTAVLTSN